MQLLEGMSETFARSLKDGQIVLANGISGRGPNLVRGTVLDVVIKGDDWISVKYTCVEHGNGDLDTPEDVAWTKSNGIFTWSLLKSTYRVGDDGVVHFDLPTMDDGNGSTARITPIAALASVAA